MRMPQGAVTPQPDELDGEFYRATAAANRVCLQHCRHCGSWTHPARYFCPNCSSADYVFEPVSGAAHIYSYTVSHVSAESAWKPYTPYVTVVAELAEGPRLVVSGQDIPVGSVLLGTPIKIQVEKKGDDFAFFSAALMSEKADE